MHTDILPQANTNVRDEITQLKSRNQTLRLLIQRRTEIIAQARQTLENLEREKISIDAEFAQLQKSAA
ncbi:hypothetical protein [Armatimonas sp.]|uniref:hypothetical protein n=1 Tax=Armatimonas sp. TaxID=1872638 RepID=UPI00286BF27E|nr:hypothetical protein [Armatimonas sp.]